jgi:peptidoglycan hydrolase-like protein with peptidoglycan-binding domain
VNRRILLSLAALAVATGAGGTAWAVTGGDSGAAVTDTTSAQASASTATATVERRDLVQHETLDGMLGYADEEPLYAQGAGTVTRLRDSGSVVKRGQPLYWVDAVPVTLMYGEVPMWRALDSSSTDGRDIRQLEWNLVALGYDPDRDIDIDREWEWATTAAVKRWQEDKGLEETGTIALGQIAFLPGPRRVGQVATTVGAPLQPGGEVLDTTSTRRVVTVDLEVNQQSLVHEGDAVTVELPDGSTLDGTIESLGNVAESETDPQTGQEGDATIPVTVELAPGARTGGLDQAPVDVLVAKDTAEQVLTVPVSALLALAEGGYAVEVVDGGGATHLVPVEPGMYADGIVEISGEGVGEGMTVVVPE